ncbi:MAG: sigma-70 family RNA polymerase sigma factor [Paludibacteraceae bacterium]|nr:sigma-70 family RNA polymerase sigma factor [Paludibacteraceae bacterium]
MTLLQEMSDQDLVRLYAEGNNDAFRHLLFRHKDYIYSYIYSFIHNHDDSNDIFQELFIKVISCIRNKNYNEEGKFRNWVLRIAHNMVMDYLRASVASTTVSAENEDFTLLNNKDICDGNIEDSIVDEQINTDIIKLVHLLPENQREVVYMRYYKNMSFKEISDKLGCSINTSLGRMHYAILNMRKMAKENKMLY